MSLSITPPHILRLWQKWHRLDQALIFTGLQWFLGLVGPFASLALPAGGCLHPCVRPSVDVSIFLVRSDKNAGDDVQSMVEKEVVADSDISMTTAGSHSLRCRVNVMIFITLAPSSNGRTHSLPSDGDGGVLWKKWK